METPAPSVTDTTTLRYLDPAKTRFFRRGSAFCVTLQDEASYPGVSVVRLFPLSDPHRYFSLRGCDGKEFGLLVDPRGLDPGSLAGLSEELRRRYVVPVIQRVLAVKERIGSQEWNVLTDRGPCVFTTRSLRESVVRPSARRCLLTDVDGNRFDIVDVEALDSTSQDFLVRYT